MDRDRRRGGDRGDKRDRNLMSSSSASDKASRLRMDSYSDRNRRPSPPRRKEMDNVMKKARRDGTDKSQYWNKKLLEAEEKDPNRWRHSGYKELYGERSSSQSKSRSHSPLAKRPILNNGARARSPMAPTSSARGRKSRSRSPIRVKPQRSGGSNAVRGRPASPPSKRRSPPSKRPTSPNPKRDRSFSGSSDSLTSCSADSCSVCSPKQTRRKAAARSRSRSFSVPRSRPAATKPSVTSNKASSGPGSKTSTATIGRKPPPKPLLPRVASARAARDKNSPPRDPRTTAPATSSKPRKDAPSAPAQPEKSPVKRNKMLAAVKIEGQKKPAAPAESDSDESTSSSDVSGAGAPKMTLSERFGKMAQWSVDRRDIDYIKNMKITKQSDTPGFKVVIDGPDEDDMYRAAAPEFTDRRVGAGFFPETMHAAPVGLSSWDDVRVRYKYYKGRGYLRDLSLDDYMKWEDWWYKYQEWLEAERYYEQWTMQSRHPKSRRYRAKHSPIR